MWCRRALFNLLRGGGRFAARRELIRSTAHERSRKAQWSFVPQLAAAAAATSFSFRDHGLDDSKRGSDDDIHREFEGPQGTGWEVVADEKRFQAHRRLFGDPFNQNYEYRCAGTYLDVTPREFIDAQIDPEYRKRWDSNILSMEVLYEEGEQQVIHWICHFPFPLYPREYIFVRRIWPSVVDLEEAPVKKHLDNTAGKAPRKPKIQELAIIVSSVLPQSAVPSSNPKYVRVFTYESRMVVRAHSSWDEHGLDFVLTYNDNPEANIPKHAYNYFVNRGGPYFLKQVHAAAKELEAERLKKSWIPPAKSPSRMLKRKPKASSSRVPEEKEKADATTQTLGDATAEPVQDASKAPSQPPKPDAEDKKPKVVKAASASSDTVSISVSSTSTPPTSSSSSAKPATPA